MKVGIPLGLRYRNSEVTDVAEKTVIFGSHCFSGRRLPATSSHSEVEVVVAAEDRLVSLGCRVLRPYPDESVRESYPSRATPDRVFSTLSVEVGSRSG